MAQTGRSAALSLEEVVVTAQRREETAQDTPVSISVMSAQDVAQRGITNTRDLIGGLPGVGGFEAPGGRGSFGISIRGLMGGAPLNQSLSPAVATYVDGVYIGKQRSSGYDVAELERIEILRGPQGTLYGRNATGGAVSIITKAPSGEFGFKVTGDVGNYNQFDRKINVDTPTLGDASSPLGTLAASFGYQKRERDGIYDNTVAGDPDFNDINREAYRVALDWRVNDDTLVAYRYDKSRLNETNNVDKVIGLTPMNSAGLSRITAMRGVLAAANGWARVPGSDPRISQRLIPSLEATINAYSQAVAEGPGRPDSSQADHMPRTTADVDGHSLTLEGDLGELGFLGEVELKSITAYRKTVSTSFGDVENFDSRLDGRGVGVMNDTLLATFGQMYGGSSGFAFSQVNTLWNSVDQLGAFHTKLNGETTYEQFSQEFQLIGTTERTEYVIGAYYFEDESTSDRSRTSAYLSPLSPVVPKSADDSSEAIAVFGQVKWTPGWMDNRFSITPGLRYTEETKDIHWLDDATTNIFGVTTAPALSLKDEDSFYNLSGALTLAYEFTDDFNGFLRYSTGFRSGGFNGEIPGNAFDEETLKQLELGVKSEWFDSRVRVNASLWGYEWKDGQVSQIDVSGGTARTLIVNAGKAKRWGAELETQALLAEDLLVSLSYAYINGDYEDFPEVCGTATPRTCIDTSNMAKRPSSPSNSLSASVDYVFLRSSIGNLRGYLQANWQDEWYANSLWSGVVSNQPFIYDQLVMDARTVVNARLSLEDIPLSQGSMRVTLWGKNLTDDDYSTYGMNLGALGLVTEQYGDPKTYGLEVVYEY